MPLRPEDVEAARELQLIAARDDRDAIRLVAGPGTGKSASVEERFRWLYEDRRVAPESVYGVSFTRAAANDLRLRVASYLDAQDVPVDADQIRVSTLHSLALRLLARANLLGAYPARPRVLDQWEVEHVFDAEFRVSFQTAKARAEEIRRAHEAFWSTGEALPAGYIAPDPPISEVEDHAFEAFHEVATQTYSAVLPGEIVRRCVEQIEAGQLVLREVADMAYLIVDEYQDLNPLDIRLVDLVAEDGVGLFVAGDDDQSIYSFRFGAPAGIQDFTTRHPAAGDHILEGCFRCAVRIVEAADDLIERYSPEERIGKTLESLWATARPAALGSVHRWRVQNGAIEARLIAESIRALLNEGLDPRKIMILLSNRRGLLPPMRRALDEAEIPFLPPKEDTWTDTDAGRFVLGILRVISDPDDYMALRIVLGCRRGVGIGTCLGIRRTAGANLLNYRDIFVEPLPQGVFTGRELSALQSTRDVYDTVRGYRPDDTLGERCDQLRQMLVAARGADEAGPWDQLIGDMPDETALGEVRDYLYAENPEQQETVVKRIFERLRLPVPDNLPEPRVRVMSMHGAKGLQADVVFIPGLEEPILPGPRRTRVPGLVLEAARLLYVSMTRARAGLILTYARRRFWQGTAVAPAPSRFLTHVGGRFDSRGDPLTQAEAVEMIAHVELMQT